MAYFENNWGPWTKEVKDAVIADIYNEKVIQNRKNGATKCEIGFPNCTNSDYRCYIKDYSKPRLTDEDIVVACVSCHGVITNQIKIGALAQLGLKTLAEKNDRDFYELQDFVIEELKAGQLPRFI